MQYSALQGLFLGQAGTRSLKRSADCGCRGYLHGSGASVSQSFMVGVGQIGGVGQSQTGLGRATMASFCGTMMPKYIPKPDADIQMIPPKMTRKIRKDFRVPSFNDSQNPLLSVSSCSMVM